MIGSLPFEATNPKRPLLAKASVVVAVLTFAIWLPTLRCDFVDWDDLNMIVHNPRFNPPTWADSAWYWVHPAWNLYQPLTTTLWAALARIGWVDVPDQFAGHMNPAIFHLAAITLHTGGAVILFGILQRVVQSETAAIIGTLMFAIHPIQVEAITFIGAMNNPLAGFLGLLAIDRYLRATDPFVARELCVRSWVTGSTALIMAMLAKPTAVVIPLIAMVMDMAVHHRTFGKAFRTNVPWSLLVLPCVIWTKFIQPGVDASRSPVWHRPVVAGDATQFYLRKVLWPIPLGIDYGRTPSFIQAHAAGWIVLLVPLSMVIAAAVTARRAPLLAAAIAIFLIALLPNAGLVPFDSQLISTVSDRYAYFAMVGVAIATAYAMARIRHLLYALVPALIVLTVLTEFQISTWINGETLFRHALAVNPDSWMSDNNLAVIVADRSPDEAVALCYRAIHLRGDRPDAWNTLGSALMSKGDINGAVDAFRRAHEIAPSNPVFASNLARASNATKK